MRVRKRREMKMKSGFQEQAPSLVHACDTNIPLIFGVKGVRK